MLEATPGKEIQVDIPNEVGALGKLVQMLAEQNIHTLAVNCWANGDTAHFRLMTENIHGTVGLLRERGYDPHVASVVVVECDHRPGIVKHLTDRLTLHEINITHLYATATVDQDECLVVISTSNNERAIVELNW